MDNFNTLTNLPFKHGLVLFCRFRFERRTANGPDAAQKVKSIAVIFQRAAVVCSQLNTHNLKKQTHRRLSVLLFVSQSHTYVNLMDLDVIAGSVSQSGPACVSHDSSLSQSKANSLSSQMAQLSKYSNPQLISAMPVLILSAVNLLLFSVQVQVNLIHHYRKLNKDQGTLEIIVLLALKK